MKKKISESFLYQRNSPSTINTFIGRSFRLLTVALLGLSVSLTYATSLENNSFSPDNWSAYQETINGTVTDISNLPLPGANIIILGTTIGTQTDLDGNFSLQASEGDVIEISYVGYKTVTITIDQRTSYNVILEEDASQLDEVVVVGYGTQRKSSLTGAISTISSDELVEAPVANATQLFSGRATGLLTRQISSEPGNDNTSIDVRGFGGALILVDGVQQNLSSVDPNNIESVSILKDAAAAIYGVRAGNGVVLITTKRGKEGKASISYHTNATFQDPTRLQSRLGSIDYLELARDTGGLDADFAQELLDQYSSGERTANTHWYDQVFTDWTPLIQHNLSATGGSENIKYFTSLGMSNQESAYNSGDLDMKRHNARINLDAKINNRISGSFDMSYRVTDRKAPRFNPSEMFNSLQTAQPIYPAVLPDPNRAAYSGFLQRSPYAQTQRRFSGENDQIVERSTAAIELKFNLNDWLKGLSASTRFDYQSTTSKTNQLTKTYDIFEYDPSLDPDDPIYNGDYPYIQQGTQSIQSRIVETRTGFTRETSNFRLSYDNSFGDHNIKAMVLVEHISEHNNSITASANDLLALSVPYFNAADPGTVEVSNGESEAKLFSYVGRFNWDYKEKYFLEAVMRIDKSWKFAPGARTGYFPGVSLGWTISKESFLENADNLNLLKLRASYSELGNDNIPSNFSYLNGFVIANPTTNAGYYIIDGTTGIINNTSLANTNTTWLNYKLINIGLEGRLWNGLLGFELDAFYRSEEGIFGTRNADFPSTFGVGLPQENLNERDDKGFEILLTHRNRINEDWSYNLSGNFSFTQERWIKLSEDLSDDPEEAAIQRRQGLRVNRFFGYQSDGLFNSQAEIDNHAIQDDADNSTLRPGDIKYIDQNGDGFIDFKDNVEIGYGSSPDVSYGLNLGVTYKNVSLSALFQGAARFNTYINGAAAAPFSNGSIPYNYHKKYSWTPDPDNPEVNINPKAKLPYITGTGLNQNSLETSDFWLKDNDYLRLKTLNINYSFPEDLMKTLGVNSMDLYLSATNLFTWDKLGIYGDSFDPETRSGTRGGPNGVGAAVNSQNGRSYPIQKSVTMGLKVSL